MTLGGFRLACLWGFLSLQSLLRCKSVPDKRWVNGSCNRMKGDNGTEACQSAYVYRRTSVLESGICSGENKDM